MNIRFARACDGRPSFRGRLALIASLASVLLASSLPAHARRAQPERPDWIASPKSSDSMYVYVVGHAAGQAGEADARDAATRDARQKLAGQIDSDTPVPAAKIHGAEVVPGCVYTEVTSKGIECWVQMSYSIAEKKKLAAKLEREAREVVSRDEAPRNRDLRSGKDEGQDASDSVKPAASGKSGSGAGADASPGRPIQFVDGENAFTLLVPESWSVMYPAQPGEPSALYANARNSRGSGANSSVIFVHTKSREGNALDEAESRYEEKTGIVTRRMAVGPSTAVCSSWYDTDARIMVWDVDIFAEPRTVRLTVTQPAPAFQKTPPPAVGAILGSVSFSGGTP